MCKMLCNDVTIECNINMYLSCPQEQYTFAYNAVRELLLLGDTAIKEHDLESALSQLKCNAGERTGYQQQFDVSSFVQLHM